MTANITNTIRKAVYRRDHYRCVLCDSTDGIQIHHVIPRGQGGSNSMHNLVTLCWRCHSFIHSGKAWCNGDEWSSYDAALACFTYVADLYAEQDWYPLEEEP